MTECKYLDYTINELEEVRDSREKININFENIEEGICDQVAIVSGINIKINDPVTYLGMIPIGGIIMWSGLIVNIPANWILCDGSSGTPNLRNNFIVGAGNNYNVGNTGGEIEHILTIGEIPSHDHAISASSSVNHTHSITTNTDGLHVHKLFVTNTDDKTGGPYAIELAKFIDTTHTVLRYVNPNTGEHNHTINVNSAGSHNHTISIGIVGGDEAHENRPPYYALCYIMRAY